MNRLWASDVKAPTDANARSSLDSLVHRHLPSGLPVLQSYGLGADASASLIAAAATLDHMGGIRLDSYWIRRRGSAAITDGDGMRDEFLLVVAFHYLVVARMLKIDPVHDYRRRFGEAYGYISKSVLESARSIEALVDGASYIDALSISRTLCSRINLLVLFALNPHLFEDWLQRPTDPKYLDGHIRQVLSAQKVEFVGQLYDELSEAIHLHDTILLESDYLSSPLFGRSERMRFRLYALGKLLIAPIAFLGVAVIEQDFESRSLPDEVVELGEIWRGLTDLVAHNRFEHLFTVTWAPDRHARKLGKDRYLLGSGFGYEAVADQIALFHRDRGNRKRLRAPYDARAHAGR